MSFPRPRLARLLPGILGPWLACAAVHAQIHEEKPLPGLEEGVLLDADGKDFGSGRTLKEPVGDKDFSILLDVSLNDLRESVLFSDGDWGIGWGIRLKSNGAVEFNGRGSVLITTPSHTVNPHTRVCIVASIKRNARQPESGIWINGIEVASGAVPPVAAGGIFAWQCEAAKLSSFHVRVYNRALTRPEILELQLRSSPREEAQTSGSAAPFNAQKSVLPHVDSYEFPKPKHPAPPPDGPRFIPQPDETIALIGGTEAVALAESGELEALLLMAFPQTRFHFRSLAWEGDTVFKQDRPMNFGSLEQQLRRINAGAVFVMFGRQECLDAAQGAGLAKSQPDATTGTSQVPLLDDFKAAFGKLLATVAKVTPNIVVIGPVPFERMPAPLPDLESQNLELEKYIATVQAVARAQASVFVNLGPDRDPWLAEWSFTVDGISLNDLGHSLTAATVAHELLSWRHTQGMHGSLLDRLQGQRELDVREKIRGMVRAKNRLWHDYWRPSNWAFLHGDRTNQPSSRDPVNPQLRFFPAEQEKYLPLIKDAEEKVFQLVQEARKKLP